MKRFLVSVMVVLLLVLPALPALANVYKYGEQSCLDSLAGIRSYSSGATWHYELSPTNLLTGYWNNGSTMTVRRSVTYDYDIWWNVEVSGGTLNDAGTHGYCSGIQ